MEHKSGGGYEPKQVQFLVGGGQLAEDVGREHL